MHKLGKHQEKDSMSDLICQNYKVLLVLSRFGIALGVGDKSIGEVCRHNGVDCHTFLAVVNLFLDEEGAPELLPQQVALPALVEYLHNSHNYFLNFRLPSIRTQLAAILETERNELSQVIFRYFDEYVAEVRKHMMYEEEHVFPYVNSLQQGAPHEKDCMNLFGGKQHNRIEELLSEFKNIIIKYYPATSSNELNSVLFDIFNCEQDLASHHAIEDRLFVPAIVDLEHSNCPKP